MRLKILLLTFILISTSQAAFIDFQKPDSWSWAHGAGSAYIFSTTHNDSNAERAFWITLILGTLWECGDEVQENNHNTFPKAFNYLFDKRGFDGMDIVCDLSGMFVAFGIKRWILDRGKTCSTSSKSQKSLQYRSSSSHCWQYRGILKSKQLFVSGTLKDCQRRLLKRSQENGLLGFQ